MIAVLMMLGLGFTVATQEAQAASPSETTCYAFEAQSAASGAVAENEKEIWCYRKVDTPRKGTLIFRGDLPEVPAELAVIVEDGGHIVHASMVAGKTTVHRLRSEFNPFGIPSTPPKNLKKVARPNLFSTGDRFEKSLQRTYDYLTKEKSSTHELHLREGQFSGNALEVNSENNSEGNIGPMLVAANNAPFRGHWWPYSGGALWNGPDSPLAKYDRYTAARGQPTSAQTWEMINHVYTGIPWQGHCNGWAASSIMRAEPKNPIHDPVSGVTFSVSDLKGLLASKDNCVQAVFFGKRYNGRAGDDINDVYPGDFHNAVLYYIGQLRKPIAMDRFRTPAIDNQIASAFDMKIKRNGDHFDVTTTLTMHKYDFSILNEPGVAPPYKKEFKYKIWIGPGGDVTKAQWLSGNNPDFLWIPVSPRICPHGNSEVKEEWLKDILKF